MDAIQERKAREAVNNALHALPIYHNALPLADVDAILTANGFKSLEEGIYCGRDGRIHEQIGDRTWIVLTWFKMDVTGRYEINSYVSGGGR